MLPDITRSPLPDLNRLGVSPSVAWELARNTNEQTAAVDAAVRLDLEANGPCPSGVIRPLADLPGWYVYRGYPQQNGPNTSQTLLALRANVVQKRLGCLPNGPTKVLILPPASAKE